MAPGSLSDYLAKPRKPSTAMCCTVIPPELMAQVEEQYAAGVRSWKAIVEWLRGEGVTGINRDHVQGHFKSGHHERSR